MVSSYVIFDQMDFPVCIIGSDGELVFKNQEFKKQVGTEGNSIKLDIDHPLYKEYRKRIAIAYHKAFSGKQTRCFAVMISILGQKLPVEIYLYPMSKDPDEPSILAFFKIVEDRIVSFDRKATPMIENERIENSNFFEFSPFPVIRFNQNYEIIFTTASIEEIVGCGRDLLIKNSNKFFEVLSEYNYERMKKTMRELFEDNIRFKRLNEIKIISMKNDVHYLNAVLYSVDMGNNEKQVEVIFEDITKVKQLEDKLSLLNHGKIISDLTRGLLHSFSNIINVISSKSQMLMKLKNRKTVAEGLNVINQSVDEATRQIRRVQEFIEIEESGSVIEEFEEVNEVIEDVIAFSKIHFKLEKKENGREILLINNKSDKINIFGNIKLFREILVSIIFKVSSNIMEYGVVKIDIIRANDLIISVQTEKNTLEDEVRSNLTYCPFPEDDIRRIAEKINMRIFEEESSKQFSIKVIIPAKMISEPERMKNGKTISKISGKNILIVEDEKALAEVLEELFEGMDNRVVVCANGRKALEKYRKDEFDIVISDYSIGGITGIELLTKVKELNEDITTVLLSGWLIDDLSDYSNIVDLFIPKPFHLDHLIKETAKVLGSVSQ